MTQGPVPHSHGAGRLNMPFVGIPSFLRAAICTNLGALDADIAVMGVPTDEGWIQAGCVLMGYPTGTWGVAARRPVDEVSFRNRWGDPVGFEVPEPLWP